MGKWRDAWRIFRRCLKDPGFREQAVRLETRGTGDLEQRGAVRALASLQTRGRLVDFLCEEIESFDDAQVGAAARSVHAECRAALQELVTLEPVLAGEEGTKVTVPEGFDPLAIRLEGTLNATPPFRAVLRHPGWRAAAVRLEDVSPGTDPMMLAPAEVEVR